MASDDSRSVTTLMSTVITELSTLFRKEIQLARAEIGEKVGEASGAIVMLIAGGVLLLAALIFLLQALVSLLTYLGVPLGWAQLIVCILATAIGAVLVRVGLNNLRLSNLAPMRTAEQLSRDAAVAKEQVQ